MGQVQHSECVVECDVERIFNLSNFQSRLIRLFTVWPLILTSYSQTYIKCYNGFDLVFYASKFIPL